MKDGRLNISKGQWELTLPSETEERPSPIRPKCRRVYGTGFSRLKRRATFTGFILHYCYLLGVLPKKTNYRPTSPYLKEDLKKLEEPSEQVRYMSKYGIETFDDLYADRDRLQGETSRTAKKITEKGA